MLSNCNSCFCQTFIHVCKKCFPPLWPHPTPGDYDSNKFESLLHVKYSLQISVFLTKLFERKIYINKYLVYFYFRFLYILFVILSPHDHSTAVWSNYSQESWFELCINFTWIWPSGFYRRRKYEKFTTTTTPTTDNRQNLITKSHLYQVSLNQKLWWKKNKKSFRCCL